MPTARLAVALAATALLLAGLLALPAADGVRVGDPPVAAAPPALAGPEVAVYALLDALLAGDTETAARQLAGDVDPVALPGLPFRFVGEGTDAPDVRGALAFFTAVVDFDVAGCRTAGAEVTCELRIDSAYARAVRVGGKVVPVAFTVEGGSVAGIQRHAEGAPALVGYCNWVRRTAPELELFDPFCVPATRRGAAAHQRRLAAEFVAAGRPVPGYGDFHPLWNRW